MEASPAHYNLKKKTKDILFDLHVFDVRQGEGSSPNHAELLFEINGEITLIQEILFHLILLLSFSHKAFATGKNMR